MKEHNKKIVWIMYPYINVNDPISRPTSICRFLNLHGYKSTIICPCADKSKFGVNEKYKYVSINDNNFVLLNINLYIKNKFNRLFQHYLYQRLVKKVILETKEKPDIIIYSLSGIFSKFIFSLKKKFDFKIILDILDLWPEDWIGLGYLNKNSFIAKVLYFFEYMSYVKCDSLFFSFEGGKKYILEKEWDNESCGIIDISKVHYINNSLDLNIFNKYQKHDLPSQYLINNNKFNIGYIGTIGKPNDIDLILDTAILAKNNHLDNFVFQIFGSGNCLEYAKNKVSVNRLDNIKFYGIIDICYFKVAINQCDIAILNFKPLPALKYGLSNNKYFMYSASAMPVLSTVRPGYSNIEKYNNGLIVDHTPEALLEGINKFMNMNKIQIDEYKNNSLKLAKDFDYNITLDSLLKEVERLCK